MASKLATALLCSLLFLSSPVTAQESINVGFGSPAKEPERPGGPGATTATKDFRWKNPFSSGDGSAAAAGPDLLLKPSCSATRSFKAHQYLLDDLKEAPPLGLGPYADRLKTFFQGREYPGSWDGLDPHGYDRNVVLMEWDDVPEAVRAWIDEQAKQKKKKKEETDEEETKAEKEKEDLSGKGLFAVYRKARAPKEHKVVIFAPGAIYETLPLWVAEDCDCKNTLLDLSKYTPEVGDGAVVGWVTEHTTPSREKQEREMQFTIRVESLELAKTAPESSSSSSVRDELDRLRQAAAGGPLLLVGIDGRDAYEAGIVVALLYASFGTGKIAGAVGDINGRARLKITAEGDDMAVVARLVAIGETVVIAGANAEFYIWKIAAAGDGIAVVREGDDIGGVGHRRDGDGAGADGRGYSRDADRGEVALPCAIFGIGEIAGAPVVIWALKIPAAADKVAVVRMSGDIGVERRRRDSSHRRHGDGGGGGAEGRGYGRDADRGESEMHIGSERANGDVFVRGSILV
ncbi:hypothetical protein PG984_016105 [Apiospora sp. TS-2023a]